MPDLVAESVTINDQWLRELTPASVVTTRGLKSGRFWLIVGMMPWERHYAIVLCNMTGMRVTKLPLSWKTPGSELGLGGDALVLSDGIKQYLKFDEVLPFIASVEEADPCPT